MGDGLQKVCEITPRVKQIGFMQGRLSPLVDGKIQAFPRDHWREEFSAAERYGFHLMEWTLDQERLYENPLMTRAGRGEILRQMDAHGIVVASLTGDCFMQAPFYKAQAAERKRLLYELREIVDACAELGMRFIVVPLVDNGRIENPRQADTLHADLEALASTLMQAGMKIIFESDFPPEKLKIFIGSFPKQTFGINYDIGNSASLGYDPVEEITAYGAWIDNVHVKDRRHGGTTVPLGTGDAKFPEVFQALADIGYMGNYILQTARAADSDHAGVLCRYRDMVEAWLGQAHHGS